MFYSYHRDTIISIRILTDFTRPLPAIDGALEVAHNGLAALPDALGVPRAQPLPFQPLPLHQLYPQPRYRAQQENNEDIIEQFAHIDHGVQAAQRRFQQQLEQANRERMVMAEAQRNQAAIQARMDALRAQAVARRRHNELRLQHERTYAAAAYDWGGGPAEVEEAGAGAGVDAGAGAGHDLAYGGLYANRAAARRREVNRWFDEQLRALPRE